MSTTHPRKPDLAFDNASWDSYARAIADGLARERDGELPMDPAVLAEMGEDGRVSFRFGPSNALVRSTDILWEDAPFSGDRFSDEPLETLSDADCLAVGRFWANDPDSRAAVRYAVENQG